MIRKCFIYIAFILSTECCLAEATVTNLSVSQRKGTKLVDIGFDILSTETNDVSVSVRIQQNELIITSTNLNGDVGENIQAGAGKTCIWNAHTDWNNNLANLSFSIYVDDKTTPCPTIKTGQKSSYRIGDDGALETGIDSPIPRFADTGSGTIIDYLTGLEWIKAPHTLIENSSSKDWNSSIDFCDTLDFSGKIDWRLPSRKELLSLIDYGRYYRPALPASHPFIGIQNNTYWTGTTLASDTNNAWGVSVSYGYSGNLLKNYNNYAWPVRSVLESAPAPVPQSGQTKSYRSGDDGELLPGKNWPNIRFVDKGNGIILDKLTGLEWIKSPHALPTNSTNKRWNDAIDFCSGFTYAGYSDWRLPTVRELESLVHSGEENQYAWLNSLATPFSGIKNSSYWSGTSKANNPSSHAWVVSFLNGYIGSDYKVNYRYIWPVRQYQTKMTQCSVDSRNYILTMMTEHGTPTPPIGIHSNYCWNSTIPCSVNNIASNSWMFTGWSGDVITDHTKTNVIVLMDTLSKTITAVFSDDADNDGILNSNEFLIGTNPRNADSDFDGFDDKFEITKGLSPTNRDDDITTYIHSHNEIFGLYDSNVVLDVSMGQMLLQTTTSNAILNLQLEQSTDLQNWTKAGDIIQWNFSTDENVKFFRVRAEK